MPICSCLVVWIKLVAFNSRPASPHLSSSHPPPLPRARSISMNFSGRDGTQAQANITSCVEMIMELMTRRIHYVSPGE
ncbi:hypothetical protein EV426DRAFT_583724 [Tirmania nivea]|nr:hypothetical protein EV426DRAFT_583724 [Tirmania nivea]